MQGLCKLWQRVRVQRRGTWMLEMTGQQASACSTLKIWELMKRNTKRLLHTYMLNMLRKGLCSETRGSNTHLRGTLSALCVGLSDMAIELVVEDRLPRRLVLPRDLAESLVDTRSAGSARVSTCSGAAEAGELAKHMLSACGTPCWASGYASGAEQRYARVQRSKLLCAVAERAVKASSTVFFMNPGSYSCAALARMSCMMAVLSCIRNASHMHPRVIMYGVK